MIPEISYPNVLVPLDIDKDPLIDKKSVMDQFNNQQTLQVLHLTEDILKPEILNILKSRGLEIDKIDVWRWELSTSSLNRPHSDGNFLNGSGRKVGLNWSISDESSRVDFYDQQLGRPEFEDLKDRSHTFWNLPEGTDPLISWTNKYPSLLNTQVPHIVRGPADEWRYSITIKFKGNPDYSSVCNKLWDLRLDQDYWTVSIDHNDLKIISQEVLDIEKLSGVVANLGHKISSYKLPTEHAPNITSVLKKYSNKKLKSLRIFLMQPTKKSDMHIDFDQFLNVQPRYALNIPLYGCEDSKVEFYRNLGDVISGEGKKSGVGGYLYPTDESKVYINSTLYMLDPTLIRVDNPHVVDNFSDHDRKILSIRFFEDPTDLPSDIVNNLAIV